jgi:phosphoglycerate dehydrogenase-like enzyme
MESETGSRPRAAFAMQSDLQFSLFDNEGLERLEHILDLDRELCLTDFDAADPELLASIEVLVTGWGAPVVGRRELELMPRLRAIFHAAGTVKGHLMPDVWDRGILVTTAAAANAYPVAEYSLAMILLAGKGIIPIIRDYQLNDEIDLAKDYPEIGNYRRTVGIIGASTVGRLVIDLLEPFDFEVLLYDPIIASDDPVLSSVQRVDLPELFRRSTVVSVHAPLLPETLGMVGAEQLALLPQGATLINTARAPIVDSDALAAAVGDGRIRAVLDVTDPEPLPLGDPLRALDDVLITPHVAGALGNELHRLGESALHEAELFLAGEPAAYPVAKSDLTAMA